MIEVSHLSKFFCIGETKVTAVNDISLRITDGEFMSIVGRSGSGKSTFLQLLGGLAKADTGEISVDEQILSNMTSNQLSEYRSKYIGFVFQAFHLEPQYSVFDNVRMPLLITGVPFKYHKEKIENALEAVGIKNKINAKAAVLSGGEKQRVAIARALINNPPIILADEPCGNLDSGNSEIIMDLLKKMSQQGKTVVVVTHNKSDAQKTERIVEFLDGRIIKDEKTNFDMYKRV